jgi:hypothetical protein
MEWTVAISAGRFVRLREEIVAFGSTEEDSGIRMTLGATNLGTATTDMGVRWQIDYQNSGDDGPMFATVTCDPPTVEDVLTVEHELAPAEVRDFYRIQNNTGFPIFGNFTNTTAISGFPDTGTPDRLVFGYWPGMVGEAWDRATNEGDTGVDFDSAVHYSFGHDAATAMPVRPGETVTRSVVIFTSGDNADCGGFVPGVGSGAELTACQGECVRLSATAVDGCTAATTALVGASPGAPPCTGNPCTAQFDDAGTFTYTWSATDAAGNETTATTVVTVLPASECSTCSTSVTAPPADRTICAGDATVLDGSGITLPGCAGTVGYEWRVAGRTIGTGPILPAAPLATTTYTLVVTCSSDTDCTTSDAVTVTVEQPPALDPPTAVDVAACGPGVELTWAPATFPSGSGVYNVHRSTLGCADALLRPALVTGLAGTRWIDATTTAGETYTYAVEAEDSRVAAACQPRGPHHAGTVARACSAPVTDVGEATFPEGVGAVLRLAHDRVDRDAVTIDWTRARSLLPGEHFHLLKTADSPTAAWANALPEGYAALTRSERDAGSRLQFFDLRVANACEVLSLDEFPPGWDNGHGR